MALLGNGTERRETQRRAILQSLKATSPDFSIANCLFENLRTKHPSKHFGHMPYLCFRNIPKALSSRFCFLLFDVLVFRVHLLKPAICVRSDGD